MQTKLSTGMPLKLNIASERGLSKIIPKTLTVVGLLALLSSCSGGGGGGSSAAPDNTPQAPDPVAETSPRTSAPLLSNKLNYNTFGQARGLLVNGSNVYVADGSTGLVILQTAADGELLPLSNLPLVDDGRAYSLQKQGDFAFVTAREEGIYVIDVSVPATPTLVTTIATPSSASYSELIDNRLYIAAKSHLIIYDVADPANPVEIAALATDAPLQQLHIVNKHAYVAAYNRGLMIVDLEDEANPSIISTTRLSVNAKAIKVTNNTALIGGENTLIAVNVSNKTSPAVNSEIILDDVNGVPPSISDLDLDSDFMHVAAATAGVFTVDVSQPFHLRMVASLHNPPTSAFGLYRMGRDLYVADGTGGVSIVDIFATTDSDGDNVQDGADVFPQDPEEWEDTDLDGQGNNADEDDDNDQVPDISDDLPLDPTETVDSDGDGTGDNSDAFVNDPAESIDTDGDGVGNNADEDDDNDGKLDEDDSSPLDALDTIRVTSNGGGNFFPKLDDDHIAWRGFNDGGAARVWIENLVTGDKQSLSDNLSGFTGIPYLSDGQVAWRMYDSETDMAQIYFWDGSERTMITEYPAGDFGMPWGFPPSYHSIDVSLHNGSMAWAGWDGNDYEIYLWDGNIITQITDNIVDDFEAQLHNGQIAWTGEEEVDGEWDVFFWDGQSIINVSEREGKPDEDAHLMNGKIAWSGYNETATKRDIYVWDGNDTTIIELPGNDYEPQIDNTTGFVFWHNVVAGRYTLHVWDGFGRTQLTEVSDFVQKSPFANNGRFAWSGYDEEGSDIYIGSYIADKDGDGVLNGQDAFPLDPAKS